MQYAQRMIESVLRWQEVPERPSKSHAVIFGVLATNGCESFTGDLHISLDSKPFLTEISGQAVDGFVPTHFTKDHIIPFA